MYKTINWGTSGSAAVSAASSALPQWHSRGYLPHLEGSNLTQLITFRLADSLPLDVAKLNTTPSDRANIRGRTNRIEAVLDSSHGACYLRNPSIAKIIENA